MAFGGELGDGVTVGIGINNYGISSIDSSRGNPSQLIKYLNLNSRPWNPEIGYQNVLEIADFIEHGKFWGGYGMKEAVFKFKLERLRIQKFASLSTLEKEMISDPFSIVVEFKNPRSSIISARVPSQVRGEVLVENTPIEGLIFYVPSDKVSIVQSYLGPSSDVRASSTISVYTN